MATPAPQTCSDFWLKIALNLFFTSQKQMSAYG